MIDVKFYLNLREILSFSNHNNIFDNMKNKNYFSNGPKIPWEYICATALLFEQTSNHTSNKIFNVFHLSNRMKSRKMLLKLLLTVNVKEITSILKGICNLSLTIFKVSISKVINWVSKQPFRPVDNIDGAGNSWLWHGCILDILKGDYTDSSIIRAIDKWQSWLYQELLLRHQLLNCSSCFWIYTGHHTTQQ